MAEPRCPICGAKSTWVNFSSEDFDLRHKFAEECQECKKAEDNHWEDFYNGPDVTQFGGDFIGNSPTWDALRQKLDMVRWR